MKRARLRRMQRVATALLALMAAIFAAATVYEARFPALAWVRAAAEAGLVGGLADWFAVVALFRHPLGLPFPHTAIIPRNKDRIGEALGSFIEGRFLTTENVLARLAGVKLADRAARWLSRGANAAGLAATLTGILPRIVEALDDSEIEALIARIAHDRLDTLDAAGLAAGSLRFMGAEGRLQPVLDQLLDALGVWLNGHRETIQARYGTRSRWTPKWADGYIVNRFVDSILDLMEEVAQAPRHDLRVAFDRAVAGLAERLETDPALREQALTLQHEMVGLLGIDRLAGQVWGDAKRRLLSAPGGAIEARLAAAIRRLAQSARRDPALLARLDAAARDGLGIVLARARPHVSGLIRDVVRRWDPREATRNLEQEVGRDLQFIRLNGTLVGAAAGLALHGLVRIAAVWGL